MRLLLVSKTPDFFKIFTYFHRSTSAHRIRAFLQSNAQIKLLGSVVVRAPLDILAMESITAAELMEVCDEKRLITFDKRVPNLSTWLLS